MDLVCVNCSYTSSFPINKLKSRAPTISSHLNVTLPAPSSFYSVLKTRRKRRRSKRSARISNFAAPNSTNGALTRTSTARAGGELMLGKSTAAMEQLDIERGVCIPFRKYTPETVRKSQFFFPNINKILSVRLVEFIAITILRYWEFSNFYFLIWLRLGLNQRYEFQLYICMYVYKFLNVLELELM